MEPAGVRATHLRDQLFRTVGKCRCSDPRNRDPLGLFSTLEVVHRPRQTVFAKGPVPRPGKSSKFSPPNTQALARKREACFAQTTLALASASLAADNKCRSRNLGYRLSRTEALHRRINSGNGAGSSPFTAPFDYKSVSYPFDDRANIRIE